VVKNLLHVLLDQDVDGLAVDGLFDLLHHLLRGQLGVRESRVVCQVAQGQQVARPLLARSCVFVVLLEGEEGPQQS
jgi:hypothetical protein